MRQQGTTRHITDGPHVGKVRAQAVINRYASAPDVKSGFFSSPAARGWATTQRHENQVGLHRVLLAFLGEDDVRPFDRLHFAAEVEGDGGHRLAQLSCHVVIHEGQDLVHHFDDGHFTAQAGEQRGELHADDTATDDGQSFRHVGDG